MSDDWPGDWSAFDPGGSNSIALASKRPSRTCSRTSCRAFFDDHGYSQWPPPRGVDQAVRDLATSLIEAQTEEAAGS